MDGSAPLHEHTLRKLVVAFYDRLRGDPELGPIFEDAIEDWPRHIDKLTAFWSSVMLTSGRYKGDPMGAHLRHLDRIRPEMFERWLGLWRRTARETTPEHAAALEARAERIAGSLRMALFDRLAPGAPPRLTRSRAVR